MVTWCDDVVTCTAPHSILAVTAAVTPTVPLSSLPPPSSHSMTCRSPASPATSPLTLRRSGRRDRRGRAVPVISTVRMSPPTSTRSSGVDLYDSTTSTRSSGVDLYDSPTSTRSSGVDLYDSPTSTRSSGVDLYVTIHFPLCQGIPLVVSDSQVHHDKASGPHFDNLMVVSDSEVHLDRASGPHF